MFNNKILRYIGFVFSLACVSNPVLAQKKSIIDLNVIQVIVRPYRDSIQLRWAPNKSSYWPLLNKSGYYIKRYNYDLKSQNLSKAILLTKIPIKPKPLASWEHYITNDDKYGAIAAQALYGKDFEMDTEKDMGSVSKVLSTIKLAEQKFSFALFAADHSFKVAQDLGLGIVDTTTKPNEIYVYEIIPADKNLKDLRNGRITTGYTLYKPLPKPAKISASRSNDNILLKWDLKPYLGIYTDYLLERSIDNGQTFSKVDELPVVNTTEESFDSLNVAYQMDTISLKNEKITYRLSGVSLFQEVSISSDTVNIVNYYTLTAAPIWDDNPIDKKNVKLKWTMPISEAEVLGFDIERTENIEKGYVKLNKLPLAPSTNEFLDIEPKEVNYYRVVALGKGNIQVRSLNKLVHIADTIPPTAPVDLSGKIDSNGVVSLKWAYNKEKDVIGYRVFRANAENDEFSQITHEKDTLNTYTDSIVLKTLNKYIYYKLVAIDYSFNPSEFSKVLKLKIPDIIPPSAPNITAVKSTPKGVLLNWLPSNSDDVVKHELLRSLGDGNLFVAIKTVSDTTKIYLDEDTKENQLYTYKLRAIDDSGLFSETKMFSAQRLNLGIKEAVKTFSGSADREQQQIVLKWKYDDEEEVKNYLIYRAEKNKPLRLYEMIDGKSKTYIDQNLLINTNYQYRIKAQFGDGVESTLSDPIIVKY